jgi:ribosomal protein S18 acetylase RimI-like enzyme
MRCELPASIANTAFLINPTLPRDELLREASAFFGPERPWRVLLGGPGFEEVDVAARQLGLRRAPSEPGMLLDPIRPLPGPPASLTIRPVENAAALADFGAVWCESFRIPTWVLPVAMPRVPPDDPERGAQNRFFVGYAEGRPVACSTVTVTERVAAIASVGTVTRARGRGYGTAMTSKAVEMGASLGADVAALAASTMGYPVYERMGFRRVAEYPSWHVPSGFFRTLRMVRTFRRLVRETRATQTASGSAPQASP